MMKIQLSGISPLVERFSSFLHKILAFTSVRALKRTLNKFSDLPFLEVP